MPRTDSLRPRAGRSRALAPTRHAGAWVGISFAAAMLWVTPPNVARAQAERAFALATHQNPAGPEDGVLVARPDTLVARGLHAQLRFDYLNRPLAVAFQGAGDGDSTPIAHRLEGALSLAYGIAERATLYVTFPFVLHQTGDSVLGLPAADERGPGDLVIGLNATLFGGPEGFAVGLGLALVEPTGSVDAFASDGRVGGHASVRLAYREGWWVVAGTVGVSLRPDREWLTHQTGSDLLLTAGFFVYPLDDIRLSAELAVASGLSDRSFGSRGRTPIEADLAGRAMLTPALYIQAGVGAGLARGVGNPRVRATVAFGWETDPAP